MRSHYQEQQVALSILFPSLFLLAKSNIFRIVLACSHHFFKVLQGLDIQLFISRSLSANELKNFIDKHYVPSRIALVGVGDIDHSSLVSLSQKYFGDLREDGKSKPKASNERVRFTGSEVFFFFFVLFFYSLCSNLPLSFRFATEMTPCLSCTVQLRLKVYHLDIRTIYQCISLIR